MRSSCRPAAVCALLLACYASLGAPRPRDAGLRYHFKPGEKLRYRVEEKSTLEVDAAGTPGKIEATMLLELGWLVGPVDKDGKATVTQTIDRVRLTAETPAGAMTYDSKAEKPAEDAPSKAIGEAMKVFVGSEMALVLDARGRLESVKFSDKLAAALAKLPPAAAAGAAQLGEGTFRRMLGLCLPVFPEQTPARGQAWESVLKVKLAGGIGIALDNKYTAEGEEKRGARTLVKIGNKPKLTLTTDPTAAAIKLTSQEAGSTLLFDRAAGRLVEGAFTQKVDMEVTENGETAKLKAKTQVTMKLIEKAK
jgi:hypothetical protein